MRGLTLLVVLTAVVAGAHAMYDANSAVTELNSKNFDSLVINSDEPWLVEFYAPWCGHCRSLTPHWEKAATELQGACRVGAVDADKDRDLGQRYGVQGFPTIKFFGENKSSPEDYNGGRTSDDIIAFGRQHGAAKGTVVEITKGTIANFVNFDSPVKLLYVQAMGKAVPMAVKKLSTAYRMGRSTKVLVGTVKETEDEVVDKFEVTAPALIAIDGKGYQVYDGENTSAALKEFIEGLLTGTNEESRLPTPSFGSTAAVAVDTIAEVSGFDDLKTGCIESGNICVVAFLNAGSDDEVATLSRMASKDTKSPLKFAWVDLGKFPKFAAMFDITAAPAVVVARLGKRNRFAKMEADFSADSLQAIVDRALGGDLRFAPLKGDVKAAF